MPVKVQCPHCEADMTAPQRAVGQKLPCPACGKTFRVRQTRKPVVAEPGRPERPPEPLPEESISPRRRLIQEQIASPTHRTLQVGLGWMAVVFGALAFLVCWIPSLRIIVAGFGGIGLIVAIFWFVIAFTHGAWAKSYLPAAGIGLTFLAVIIANERPRSVRSTPTPPNFAAYGEESPDVRLPSDNSIETTNPPAQPKVRSQDPPQIQPRAPSSRTGSTTVVGLNKWVTMGDVSVRVVGAKVGRVPLKTYQETTSQDPLLTIDIEIRNDTTRKKIEYQTWRGKIISFHRDSGTLTDDVGNEYKRIDFGPAQIIGSVNNTASIYPTESVQDKLVFEVPVKGFQYVDLNLIGANVEAEGIEATIRLPTTLVEK